MINIYKKVEKKEDNYSGIEEITSIESLNKPFLLCLSAQDIIDKSIYGIIKEGAQAARVLTTEEDAARFKIDDMPIDFLGLRFKKEESSGEDYEEIADAFLYPFLVGDGTRTFEEIQKQARKINLMTYCDGILKYKGIEDRLKKRLNEDGLTQEQIDSILSQISLSAIATMVPTRDIKATTITFVDVNDREIAQIGRTDRFIKQLHDNGRKSLYGHTGTKNTLYVYEGSGKHDLKEYFLPDKIVKPVISSVISYFLENSVENEKSSDLIPISSSGVFSQLKEYADESVLPSELLDRLDGRLTYGNAPRYSPNEAILIHRLDSAFKTLQKVESLEKEKSMLKKKNDSLIQAIGTFSSETTARQILESTGYVQASYKRDVFQEKSDKMIRELYDAINLSEESVDKTDSGPKL